MKSSDALIKASTFYQSNNLPVIGRQAGVSPRLIAYDRDTGEMILVAVRRPRSKNYRARQKSCRNIIDSLLAWRRAWVKSNNWEGQVRLESISVYTDGEMDRIFHSK